MPEIKYDITGLERLKKPGTYDVRVSGATTNAGGDVTVYGHVVDPPLAADDQVAAVAELDNLLMRPFFVNRRAAARLHATETRRGQTRAARTQRGKSVGEVLDIVAAWVEKHSELLTRRRLETAQPVDLNEIGIPELTDEERDRFMAALEDDGS